jgi:thiol-disulfide isomerase/thioredoxin
MVRTIFLLAVLVGCGPKVGPDSAKQCQNTVGEQACNIVLKDQNNQVFDLYAKKHHGKYIALDFSTMWCGPCQFVASHLQGVADENPDLLYVTVLYENLQLNDPDQEDLKLWTETFGIQEPVLAGSRSMVGNAPSEWEVYYIPTYFLLDQQYVIQSNFTGADPVVFAAELQLLME